MVMKKALCLFFCLIVALSFASCSFPNPFDDRASKEDIFAYVKENEAELLDAINKDDFLTIRTSTRIIQLIDDDEIGRGFVDFDCGGSGFGSETSYCGFFYSADNDMTERRQLPFGEEFKESGDGYLWEESWNNQYGDNTYYVENICTHFYYYEEFY